MLSAADRHAAFLKDDILTLSKMYQNLKVILDATSMDVIIEALIALGKSANDIHHDGKDKDCIRNCYSTQSDFEDDKPADRIRPSGIPIQSVSYIAELINSKIISSDILMRWFTLLKPEFRQLAYKIEWVLRKHSAELALIDSDIRPLFLSDVTIPSNINEITLTGIINLGAFANDISLLKLSNHVMTAANIVDLDMATIPGRYWVARIYTVIGESAKTFSSGFRQQDDISTILYLLGNLRNEFKMPNLIVSNENTIKSAYIFIFFYHDALLTAFTSIHESLLNLVNTDAVSIITAYPERVARFISEFSKTPLIPKMLKDLSKFTAKAEKSKSAPIVAVTPDLKASVSDITISFDDAVKYISDFQAGDLLSKESENRLKSAEFEALSEKEKNKERGKNKSLLKQQAEKLAKYREYYETNPSQALTLPKPDDKDALLAFDCTEIIAGARTKTLLARAAAEIKLAKQAAMAKLLHNLQLLKEERNKLPTLLSPGLEGAKDQCTAYIGVLNNEIQKAIGAMDFEEPLPSSWASDLQNTYNATNEFLKHNLIAYREEAVTDVIYHAILPWNEILDCLLFIAKENIPTDPTEYIHRKSTDTTGPSSVSRLLHQVGLSYLELRQFTAAITYFNTAIALETEATYLKAFYYHNLAEAYRDQTDWAHALEAMQNCMAIRRAVLHEEDDYYISTLHNLALCLKHNGQITEAIAHYEEAIAIAIRHKKPPHNYYKHLADLYADQGNYKKAQETYRNAESATEDLDHILHLRVSWARMCMENNLLDDALSIFLSCQELISRYEGIFKKTLGEQLIDLRVNILTGLAEIHLLKYEYDKALEILSTYKSTHPELEFQRAKLFSSLENFEQARKILTPLSALSGTVENDIIAIQASNILASFVLKKDDPREASDILLRSLVILEHYKSRGYNYPFLQISVLNNLSAIAMDTENFEESLCYADQAMALVDQMSIYGASLDIHVAFVHYVFLNLKYGDYRKATASLKKYKNLFFEAINKSQDPVTIDHVLYMVKEFSDKGKINIALTCLNLLRQNYAKLSKNQRDRLVCAHKHVTDILKTTKPKKAINCLMQYLVLHKSAYLALFLVDLLKEYEMITTLALIDLYRGAWLEIAKKSENPNVSRHLTSLYFICADYCAKTGQIERAIAYWQESLKLNLYSFFLCKEKTHIEPSDYEILNANFWQISKAIANVSGLTPPQTRANAQEIESLLYTLKPSHLIHGLNYKGNNLKNLELLNKCFFANQFIIKKQCHGSKKTYNLEIPSAWCQFLNQYKSYHMERTKASAAPKGSFVMTATALNTSCNPGAGFSIDSLSH